jgi:homoserine kinase
MTWAQDVVRVRVPATSANLGPGFDALGLALTLYDDVDAWICPSGLSIEISGEGADLAEAGEEHLVLRAMRAAFAVTGGQPPGIGLRCVNRIPHGRGLGSSAAAIVAGILAGTHPGGLGAGGLGAAAGDGAGELDPAGLGVAGNGAGGSGTGGLPDEALLGLATGLEGHPDNVAACLAGGLTVAWTAAGHPRMVHLDPLPSLMPVICVAPAPIRTDVARRLLPDLVPHHDAAANAGRSALLVAALTQLPPVGASALFDATANALFDATQDWLHQDYRAAAMPETAELVKRLRDAGIPAVVSGAGLSVLALLVRPERTDYRHHLDRLGSIVRETGIAWHISSLDVERHGARVLRPEPSPGC